MMLDEHFDNFSEAYGYQPSLMLVSWLVYRRYEASLTQMTRFVDSEGPESATRWLAFKTARVYSSPMLRGNEVFCA